MDDFKIIILDFKKDILLTFPEYKDKLTNFEDIIDLYNYCKKLYPQHFFDIVYKKEELFDNSIYLLPDIDFNIIWKENITDKTRETIWRYLQLILFNIIGDIKESETFGDAAKLFEAINKDELKDKLHECLNEMQNMFDNNNNIDKDNLPDPEDIHDHITGMLDGKLGRLAKEIAEETAQDLNIDSNDNTGNVEDIFKKLFSNPNKLMNLVKNVGGKLDQKMKNGDINEGDLVNEAQDLVKKMKDIPGLGNINNLFKNMSNNPQMNAFHNKMKQQMNRENMKNKMENRKNKDKDSYVVSEEELKQAELLANKMMNDLLNNADNINKTVKNPKGNRKKKKKKK